MGPRKLFVIGNGFDLHHRIPSSYAHFRDFVQAQDRGVFDAVERYLHPSGDWADMEAALAEMDPDEIIEDLSHFMGSYGADDWSDSGHHDFQYEVDLLVERMSTELRRLFGLWIRQLQIPTQLPIHQTVQVLDPTGAFLSFNYTETLSLAYGIPREQILYIHGCADQVDQELILGHGWKPEDRHPLNDRPDVAELDTRLTEANDILDCYFSKTFKPSDKLIQAHAGFFEWISSAQEVYVLGHSLSDVDAPYFEAMLRNPSVRQANVHLAIHKPEEEPDLVSQLIDFGFPASNIRTYSWAELCLSRPLLSTIKN
ncbi:TPA: bacteriophage abortive infection AbiH family protein [Stenotrophomonas maltophilia]